MAELLAALIRANLAGSVAVLLVLAIRPLARGRLAPQTLYGLWLTPPLAMLGALLPPLTAAPQGERGFLADLPGLLEGAGLAPGLTVVWLAGALIVAAMFGVMQLRFLRAAKAGRAGPAVVGLLSPKIIMPADEARYGAEERRLVRAHEQAHLARGDHRAVALAAVLQCLSWFNPLVFMAVRLMRLDQELACDAAVMARYPRQRRAYAEALLKTQLSPAPPPLGCAWPAPAPHPLEVRVTQMVAGPKAAAVGPALVAGLALASLFTAWLTQPPAPPHDRPQWSHQRPILVLVNLAP
ncbi:M56 family metallopeptidase [Caulobacter segnis]|uniref:M56 family metallopeptidase n=1 Tax=Caulobacter segnis TaxID=88688 RepID=UPI00240ED90E|nr:M56 family metallopeptidase [Caulobacter segnis]MDG2520221.1 M56 family metallopeptidase [Caulobacter segnis]